MVITYNLEGNPALKLDADTIAGIFLGTIKKWNDPKIAATNPGTKLPDKDIVVVHRSDGSGTTFIFHRLPEQGQFGVEIESGHEHIRELASRDRWQRVTKACLAR